MSDENMPLPFPPNVENLTNLDEDHYIKYISLNDERIGFVLWHRAAQGISHVHGWCAASVYWNRYQGPLWTLVSMEPLHVEPSILCGCGEHGWIRDGKWQSA